MSSWHDKILEIKPLGLTAVGLFLTGVTPEQRLELYRTLEHAHASHRFTIPFVHAVADMHNDEYDYLVENFGTELFNLHPSRQFPLVHDLSYKTRQRITIENAFIDHSITMEDLLGFNGVCMDVAHAEDLRRTNPVEFDKLTQLVNKTPVRANHISVVHSIAHQDSLGQLTFHSHVLAAGGDIEYLQLYSPEFYGPILAIELADSLADQCQLIARIETIMESKKSLYHKTAA